MAKITDLDQNLVGGNEPRNLVGDTSITVEPLELKAKSVLQILKNFRNYIIENAVKGDTGAQGLSIIDVDITLTSESLTGNTYTLTCTLSDNSTITAGTFFVPKGDKGDTGDTGATGNGIASIAKTGTAGLVDSYRITFTDGTYFDFNVTNGQDGVNGQDGTNGLDALFYDIVYQIASSPADISAFSLEPAHFNRTPNVSEKFPLIWKNSSTLKTYAVICEVISVSSSSVTCGAFSYVETTGAKGDTGATGNGIASITKTGTAGLIDTYTITYTNGNTDTFAVTNGQDGATGATGNGIASITKTGTAGLVDTYTITYTNGNTDTFTVTNGQDGATGATGNGIVSITKTGTSGLVDTYTILYTNGNTDTFTVTNGVDGAGTEIYVNGVAVSSVSFTSDPQTQITNLGTSKQDKIDSSHKLSADLLSDGTTNKVFTATEQSKLAGIASGAEVNVQSDWNQTNSSADDYIKNKPTIPTVNDGTLVWNNDGIQIFSFSANQSGGVTANTNLATKTLGNVTYPANTAGSTTTGYGDRVIETYISSISSGFYKWYRKWASGWKECGGYADPPNNNAWNNNFSMTFGITFSQAPIVTCTVHRNFDNGDANMWGNIRSVSTSSFTVQTYRNGSNGGQIYYYACGY